MSNPRRWLRSWLIASACACALAAATNYLVDPYGLYRRVDVVGFNQQKEGVRNKIRHVKALELPMRAPRTLLMGSSRVHDGLNPEHPLLRDLQPVYNLGIEMCRIHEALRYLEHGLQHSDVKRVVFGLDYFMFNAREKNNPAFEPALVGHRVGAYDYATTTLLSLDALRDSFQTIKASHAQPGRNEFRSNGFRPGKFVFFGANDYPNLHYLTNWTFLSSIPRPVKYYADISIDDEVFAEFEDFLQLCSSRGLDCRLYINPAHAALDGEGLRAAGQWPAFEDWKRRVTAMAQAHKAPLWDFSGYNSVTTEPVRTPMAYYWDSSHFTEPVGDWILTRIMEGDTTGIPADFGVRLTTANIETHLMNIRAARERYAAENSSAVAAMATDYSRYLHGEPLDVPRTLNLFKP